MKAGIEALPDDVEALKAVLIVARRAVRLMMLERFMSFYVTLRRGGETRIHKSSCSYCKDGKGFGSIFKVRRNNTVLSPPLATLVEAEAYASNHHGKVVRCGHCLAPSADIT